MTAQQTLKYALVRYQPDRARHEIVNIGTVVFAPEGPRLCVAQNLTKLLAIDPNISLMQVQDEASQLNHAMGLLWGKGLTPEALTQYFGQAKAGITLSANGLVDTQGKDISDVMAELQRDLVTSPTKTNPRNQQSSRLHSELKAAFKAAKMLGRSSDDISRHLVVANYPIDAEVGLFAEFALQNTLLHVTETVDFRTGDPAAKKREAEAKTLVLLQALETVGAKNLLRHVVVSGAGTNTQASINLLGRYTDDLVVRESNSDWERYIAAMAKAANLPEMQLTLAHPV